MSFTSIYRIFNGTERISTAIQQKDTKFLQVKPSKAVFDTQASWIAATLTTNPQALISITREDKPRPKPWSEMTEDELIAYNKLREEKSRERYETREKINALKRIASKASETTTIRAIRSLYDTNGLRDTLSLKGRRLISNPGLFVSNKGALSPVYFSRKTGNAIVGSKNETPDFGDLVNVFFYIYTNKSTGAMRRVKPDLTVPNPNEKTILYLCCNPTVRQADEEYIAKIIEKGFKVKSVVFGGRQWHEYVREYKYDPSYYEIMRGPWGFYSYPTTITYYKNVIVTENTHQNSSWRRRSLWSWSPSASLDLDAWLAKFAPST